MARSWLSLRTCSSRKGSSATQPVEIVLADREQPGVGLGANGGGARAVAQQRHFAKRLAVAEFGERALVAAVQHFDDAVRDNIESVARIAGAEHDLAGLDLTLLNAIEQRFDLLGRRWRSRSHFDNKASFSPTAWRLRSRAYSRKRDG